jgi:SAM-dependent methyltransferase
MWDKVYSKRLSGLLWYPSEGVVRFTARYLKRRVGIETYHIKKEVRRILDLGCGNGRHVIFFTELGFDVYGVDISKEAIEIAKAWLSKKGLKANLTVADIEKLPFQNKFFDVVISYGVLDHILFTKSKKVMDEISRVLIPKGYVYITLRSTEDSEFARGKKIAHNTFLLQEGYEKGIIQHYFDLEEINELFSEGFKIFDIEVYEEKYSKIYSLDKPFLQSSKGIKKYITPLNAKLDFKSSRWYIAAEKR